MSDPFIGEVRMFGGNFAPSGWALCNGQLLSIAQNTALFSLLGTMYGGNGTTTFGLPDLQDRVPVHRGQGPGLDSYEQGGLGGTQNVTLTMASMPAHTHPARAVNDGADQPTPGAGTNLAAAPGARGQRGPAMYSDATSALTPMGPNSITPAGSSLPVPTTKPVLVVSYIIALQGIFPSRS